MSWILSLYEYICHMWIPTLEAERDRDGDVERSIDRGCEIVRVALEGAAQVARSATPIGAQDRVDPRADVEDAVLGLG